MTGEINAPSDNEKGPVGELDDWLQAGCEMEHGVIWLTQAS